LVTVIGLFSTNEVSSNIALISSRMLSSDEGDGELHGHLHGNTYPRCEEFWSLYLLHFQSSSFCSSSVNFSLLLYKSSCTVGCFLSYKHLKRFSLFYFVLLKLLIKHWILRLICFINFIYASKSFSHCILRNGFWVEI